MINQLSNKQYCLSDHATPALPIGTSSLRDREAHTDLQPGDILSYSAGSTQTGPEGYRKVTPSKIGLLAGAARRWPELASAIGDRTVLIINAYPATIGAFPQGITVDTYLSPRILTRALKLGHAGDRPVILIAQPLFLADALMRYIEAGHKLPKTLTLCVGGYVMPRGLEATIESVLAEYVDTLHIVQYFGAAEVDAGCMMARTRNHRGELVYYPREDVEADLDGDDLLLTLRSVEGEPIIERFRTGDNARREGEGWVIWNPRRLHPDVQAELDSWTGRDWKRRTGYVRRDGDTIWIQLRQGQMPSHPAELDHFDFARCFGFSWLDKPYWR